MNIIKETTSICPYCMQKLNAQIIEEDNQIYLYKKCSEHGEFKTLIWSNTETYKKWDKYSAYASPISRYMKEKEKGCPYDCGLCSAHNGGVCTAVIEVTDRCNMKCPICFASADCNGSDESLEKIKDRISSLYQITKGCSLQLSGGEATLRDDLPYIVNFAKKTGFKHVQVNTNGLRISKDIEYLGKLRRAGCDLIYLQFDGTDDAIYRYTRGHDMIQIKKRAIINCKKVGIGVMLVPVIINGVNDKHLNNIIQFAKSAMPTVKGIHFQPVSFFGRYPGEIPQNSQRYTMSNLIDDLGVQTKGEISINHMVPRKKQSAFCSFSATYFLNKDKKLVPLSKFGTGDKKTLEKTAKANSNNENMEYYAYSTNKYTRKYWKQVPVSSTTKSTSKWQSLKDRMREYSLAISSMPFQDVWNMDIDRIQNCCVFVYSKDKKLVPLCLYYMTDANGNKLYEGGVCQK